MKTNVIALSNYREQQQAPASAYTTYLDTLARSDRKAMTPQLRLAARLLDHSIQPENFPLHTLNFKKCSTSVPS